MMTAYYLVCEERGVAFLRSAIPQHVNPTNRVLFYSLADPLAVRNICIYYPKRKTCPLRQELIRYLKEETNLN